MKGCCSSGSRRRKFSDDLHRRFSAESVFKIRRPAGSSVGNAKSIRVDSEQQVLAEAFSETHSHEREAVRGPLK